MYLLSARWHCFVIWHSMQPPPPMLDLIFIYITLVICYIKKNFDIYLATTLGDDLDSLYYISVSLFVIISSCIIPVSGVSLPSRISAHTADVAVILSLSLSPCSAPREREEGVFCPCAGEHLNKCFVFVQNSLL